MYSPLNDDLEDYPVLRIRHWSRGAIRPDADLHPSYVDGDPADVTGFLCRWRIARAHYQYNWNRCLEAELLLKAALSAARAPRRKITPHFLGATLLLAYERSMGGVTM